MDPTAEELAAIFSEVETGMKRIEEGIVALEPAILSEPSIVRASVVGRTIAITIFLNGQRLEADKIHNLHAHTVLIAYEVTKAMDMDLGVSVVLS